MDSLLSKKVQIMKDWFLIPLAIISFLLGFNYGASAAEIVAYPKEVRTEDKTYLEWTSYIRLGSYACVKETDLQRLIDESTNNKNHKKRY